MCGGGRPERAPASGCIAGERKEGDHLLRIKENEGGKCSLRHCVSSVARFYHISTGLSRRLRTSCRRSCSSRRWATSGEWFLCKEMPWFMRKGFPVGMSNEYWGVGGCVYRSAASLRNNNLQYSTVAAAAAADISWLDDEADQWCCRGLLCARARAHVPRFVVVGVNRLGRLWPYRGVTVLCA